MLSKKYAARCRWASEREPPSSWRLSSPGMDTIPKVYHDSVTRVDLPCVWAMIER